MGPSTSSLQSCCTSMSSCKLKHRGTHCLVLSILADNQDPCKGSWLCCVVKMHMRPAVNMQTCAGVSMQICAVANMQIVQLSTCDSAISLKVQCLCKPDCKEPGASAASRHTHVRASRGVHWLLCFVCYTRQSRRFQASKYQKDY